MVYVGVDLHRKRSHVVALDDGGKILASHRIPTEAAELLRVFGECGPEPVEVAFEATFGWGWFADLLVDAGIPAHMAHPLTTKAISMARVKNDAVDAKTLAHLLRTNLLPEAWIAPPDIREARRLVRMRTGLVRMRSRLKCQIHAVLGEHGVRSQLTDLFGLGGRRFLDALSLPAVSHGRLEANLRLIDALGTEIARADRELRQRYRGDERIRRLMLIPGIGFLTAATVLAEVGDFSRFASPDKLCSWAGLTPSEHSSDTRVRQGHITKQGSRWLRTAMVEAAATIRKVPELRRFRDRIERKRGKKIARVALARRLLTLSYYAVRDEAGCRAYPVPR